MDLAQLMQFANSNSFYSGQNQQIEQQKNLLANDKTLQDIAVSRGTEQRNQEAHPLLQQQRSLGNIGQDIKNKGDTFELNVKEGLGQKHFIDSAKLELETKKEQSRQAASKLLTQIGADITGMSELERSQYIFSTLTQAKMSPEHAKIFARFGPEEFRKRSEALAQQSAAYQQALAVEEARRKRELEEANIKREADLAKELARGKWHKEVEELKDRLKSKQDREASDRDYKTVEANMVRYQNQMDDARKNNDYAAYKEAELRWQTYSDIYKAKEQTRSQPDIVPVREDPNTGETIYGPNRNKKTLDQTLKASPSGGKPAGMTLNHPPLNKEMEDFNTVMKKGEQATADYITKTLVPKLQDPATDPTVKEGIIAMLTDLRDNGRMFNNKKPPSLADLQKAYPDSTPDELKAAIKKRYGVEPK